MMETPPTLDTSLVRANTYLDGVKLRLRTRFDHSADGKFAQDYDKSLEKCLEVATQTVDGEYESVFGEGNVPKSDDFLAARTIALAQKLDQLMRSLLDDYIQGRGIIPPSQDQKLV